MQMDISTMGNIMERVEREVSLDTLALRTRHLTRETMVTYTSKSGLKVTCHPSFLVSLPGDNVPRVPNFPAGFLDAVEEYKVKLQLQRQRDIERAQALLSELVAGQGNIGAEN